VTVLTWPGLDDLGVDAVVTTRGGGVSEGPYASLNLGLHVGDDPDAVLENRARAAAAVGATPDELVVARQVHGTGVETVTEAECGRGGRGAGDAVGPADALVTTAAGPVLVTLVADCSPILLVDPEARVLATVHAGWRGALAQGGGAAGAAVRRMAACGARAERIVAIIGPTVAAPRYAVGDEVVAAAAAAFGRRAADVLGAPDAEGADPAGDGARRTFDVAGANRLQLLAAGIPEPNVHRERLATDAPLFYSDRAERPCGRFGLLARLVGG
jgi:YfiH family protein